MRALELAAVRAGLPLRYSQGFNPHPVMSLPCPRPVAVASLDDVWIVSLEPCPPDEPNSAADAGQRLVAALRQHVPEGLRILRAEPLAPKARLRPVRIDYVLPLAEGQRDQVERRTKDLARADAWPVERIISDKSNRRARAKATRTVDVKPLTAELTCRYGELRWSAVPSGDAWARPSEVLRLLDLDERVTLAQVTRTHIQCACPDSGATHTDN